MLITQHSTFDMNGPVLKFACIWDYLRFKCKKLSMRISLIRLVDLLELNPVRLIQPKYCVDLERIFYYISQAYPCLVAFSFGLDLLI